jgi:hypothetical protein
LEQQHIPVLLTIQVDSIAKPGQGDITIPANVAHAVNFYQSSGLLHGRSEILAMDPERTNIIGNFHMTYKDHPVNCEVSLVSPGSSPNPTLKSRMIRAYGQRLPRSIELRVRAPSPRRKRDFDLQHLGCKSPDLRSLKRQCENGLMQRSWATTVNLLAAGIVLLGSAAAQQTPATNTQTTDAGGQARPQPTRVHGGSQA